MDVGLNKIQFNQNQNNPINKNNTTGFNKSCSEDSVELSTKKDLSFCGGVQIDPAKFKSLLGILGKNNMVVLVNKECNDVAQLTRCYNSKGKPINQYYLTLVYDGLKGFVDNTLIIHSILVKANGIFKKSYETDWSGFYKYNKAENFEFPLTPINTSLESAAESVENNVNLFLKPKEHDLELVFNRVASQV